MVYCIHTNTSIEADQSRSKPIKARKGKSFQKVYRLLTCTNLPPTTTIENDIYIYCTNQKHEKEKGNLFYRVENLIDYVNSAIYPTILRLYNRTGGIWRSRYS